MTGSKRAISRPRRVWALHASPGAAFGAAAPELGPGFRTPGARRQACRPPVRHFLHLERWREQSPVKNKAWYSAKSPKRSLPFSSEKASLDLLQVQRRRNRRQRPAHRTDPCKQATQLQSGGCTPPTPRQRESDKLRVAGSHNWRAFLSTPRQLAWADPETSSSPWSSLP